MKRFYCEIQHMGNCDSEIVAGFQATADRVLFDNQFDSVQEAQTEVDIECWEWLLQSGIEECYTTESPVVYEAVDTEILVN